MRTKWEYGVWHVNSDDAESTINQLGDDGWELVSVVRDDSDADGSLWTFCYFKREVDE